MKKFLLLIILASFLLTACGSSQPGNILTGFWDVISYGTASNQTPTMPNLNRALIFEADGKFSGNMGCNSFSGNYTITGDTVTIEKTTSTQLACVPDIIMQQEIETLKILTGTLDFKVEGRKLTFTGENGVLHLQVGGN